MTGPPNVVVDTMATRIDTGRRTAPGNVGPFDPIGS